MRIVIIADTSARRSALEHALRGGTVCSGSFPPLPMLAPRILDLHPDAILFDHAGRVGEGVRSLTQALAREHPVAVLAEDPDASSLAEMLGYGVLAILDASAEPERIRAALEAAALGLVLLDSRFSRLLAGRVPRTAEGPEAEAETLTARELEVLRLLAGGLGNREIASHLHVSEHTIKFHVSSILSKLGASSRTEAVTSGIRKGWIPL